MRGKHDIETANIESIADKYDLPHMVNDIVLMPSLRSLSAVMEARRLSLCLFIGVCTSGVVKLMVNDRSRVAVSNNAMVITEESVVNDLHFSDDFDGMGIFLSYKLLQDVLRDVHNMSDLFLLTHNYPVFELKNDETQEMCKYFSTIKNRIEMPVHRHRREVIRLLLLTMIYDLAEAIDRTVQSSVKDERQSRSERIFVEFIQRVRTHYTEHRKVQWYAEQMNITPKYLSEVISNASRRSPNEWIDKFVTAEMRNQLRHTDKPISEISDEMHFTSQSFFGKYFKENVGVSPTEYRNGIEPQR